MSEEKTVGSAVYDILEKDTHAYEVQEIIDGYAQDYTNEVRECVEKNWGKFESPFYVVVLHKKEPWALNVLRNYFIARQTEPDIKTMWTDYRHFMHTVYKVDKQKNSIDLLRSLPSPDEAKTILQNWALYDAQLVKWCQKAFEEMKAA